MIIALEVIIGLINLLAWSIMLYNPYFKRFWDIVLSSIAIVILSPLMLALTILGAIKMKGNPFFTQLRPGKKDKHGKEKFFKLIKFRSMTCEKDKDGNLLPDEVRLTNYGKKVRSTSIDELPELFNILKGDMSIVGPRPQLVRDMVFMTDEQRIRHNVKPGLTGLAQIKGRNAIDWEEKFKWDIEYIQNISFINDVKIIGLTYKQVFVRRKLTESSEEIDLTLDYGDALLESNKVTKEKYELLQKEARNLINDYTGAKKSGKV